VFSVSHEQLQAFRTAAVASESKPTLVPIEIFGAALGAGWGLGKLSAIGPEALLRRGQMQEHDYSSL
jgi:hypothetical protein